MVLTVHNELNGTWTPKSNCGGLSLAVIIGSTTGTLIFIGLALLVAVVVIININDLRRWKQYQAWRRDNEERLGVETNPIYQVICLELANTVLYRFQSKQPYSGNVDAFGYESRECRGESREKAVSAKI